MVWCVVIGIKNVNCGAWCLKLCNIIPSSFFILIFTTLFPRAYTPAKLDSLKSSQIRFYLFHYFPLECHHYGPPFDEILHF